MYGCSRASFRLVRRGALFREALEHGAIEHGLTQAACGFERLRQLGRQRRALRLDDQQRAGSISGRSKVGVRRKNREDDDRD